MAKLTLDELVVIINAQTGNLRKEIAQVNSQLNGMDRQATKTTSSMGRALAKVGKAAAVAFVAAGTAFAAMIGKFVIGGGISRALNIEDAQAKLKGLGHDTKSVEAIMDSALKSVKGTAYGLDAAATAAASAVAAGVKPGKDLTRVLGLTADAATIMGREFGDAGAIINKVLASNRVSMEEVNQLHDAGVPILSMLAKEYKVTAGAMRKMVSDGEVDSKRFLKAIEDNISGAALESGKTTRGAWENMKAAMARVGAAIAKDIIPKIRDAFGDMTKWFDDNSEKIVDSVGDLVDIFKEVGKQAIEWGKKAVEVGKDIANYLEPKVKALWNTLKNDLIPALKEMTTELLAPLAAMLGKTLVGALGVAVDLFNAFAKVISPILRNIGGLKDAIIVLGIAFTGLKVIAVAQNALTLFGSGLVAATVRTVGFSGALSTMVAAINPVTAVLVAAGLVFAGLNKAINEASNNYVRLKKAQADAAQVAAEAAATSYQSAIQAYKDLNNIAGAYLSTTKQLHDAEEQVKVARQKLAEATRNYGKDSQQAKDATAQLSEAQAREKQLEVERDGTMRDLIDKTLKLTESGGALKNTTRKQMEADLLSARAIRDLALARGEDTTKIDGVIDTLEDLILIKDQTITTKVKPGSTHIELQNIRRDVLNIPESRTVKIASDLSNFRMPNPVISGWKGVPYYHSGGFTGRGGKYDPAGIVHKGEYVIPKEMVDQTSGLPKMFQNLNIPHFSAGGLVGGRSMRMDKIGKKGTPININLDGERLLSFVIDGINGKSFMSNNPVLDF